MIPLGVSLRLHLLTLIVLNGCQTDSATVTRHQGNLCEAMDVSCCKDNCDDCYMKYYKVNSTECKDLTFSTESTGNENDLGSVKIQSYHYHLLSYKQTGFNVTFANITWSDMKFRFKQEGNEMKNTCREFYFSKNSTLTNMFYDCLWSNETYEGKTFSFEYEMRRDKMVSYKKFSFRVPLAGHIDETTDLENWEIFMYTELLTNAFGLTSFLLRWQPLPERFNIHTYNVSVFTNNSGQSELTYCTNISCSSLDNCKFYYNKWYGSVQFGVQPIPSNSSDCYLSKTSVFHLGGENNHSLLIGIVSVTVIIPAFLYVLFLMRNYFISKTKKWIYPVPKVLIIFTPSLLPHVKVVTALAEYLKMYCNVEPLVDELDIFRSKTRDPFIWCNEAFKSADFVMVVASPYHRSLRLADSVYKNTDVLLLRILQEKLGSRSHKTRFFVLMLPYCSDEDVPSEAVNLRRYSFPKDLNKILKYIHKDNSLPFCASSEIQGGKDVYRLFGSKLKNSITEAQVSLMRNRSEYDRKVAEKCGASESDRCASSVQQPLLGCSPMDAAVDTRPKAKRKVLEELAEDVFGEFPGRLDDMNLSGGEEMESLVGVQRWSSESNDVINLDALEL